jgi:hypothetical protein
MGKDSQELGECKFDTITAGISTTVDNGSQTSARDAADGRLESTPGILLDSWLSE